MIAANLPKKREALQIYYAVHLAMIIILRISPSFSLHHQLRSSYSLHVRLLLSRILGLASLGVIFVVWREKSFFHEELQRSFLFLAVVRAF
jgi:hypothetical protein